VQAFATQVRSGCEEGMKLLKHKQIYFVLAPASQAWRPGFHRLPRNAARTGDDNWLAK
jgi:hypothetical protein